MGEDLELQETIIIQMKLQIYQVRGPEIVAQLLGRLQDQPVELQTVFLRAMELEQLQELYMDQAAVQPTELQEIHLEFRAVLARNLAVQ